MSSANLGGLLGELIAGNFTDVATVVHLGAGACAELAVYRQLEAERVVLVEPNADVAADLGADPGRIDVIPAAIAAEDGRGTLHVTNDPRFSALREPKAALEHYPGLRVTETREVDTLTLATLLERISLDAGPSHLLVCELLAVEAQVLNAAAARDLKHFRQVLVRTLDNGRRPDHDPVRESLVAADFTVMRVPDPTAPFLIYLAIRNPHEVLFETEAGKRRDELQRLVSEYEHRQRLTGLELARAQGQIDLLRDLLLDER